MIPVLIVEDEFLVRVGLRSMIDWEKHGFSVVADASNGERGLELFQQHRPYLVLTDIRMSPMNGLEMMREIRKLDSKVHFVVISAYNEFDYAQEAIRQGVDLYLNKASFTEEELVPLLERLRTQYETSPAKAPTETGSALRELLTELPERGDLKKLDDWMQSLELSKKPKRVISCRFDRSAKVPIKEGLVSAMLQEVLSGLEKTYSLYRYNAFFVLLTEASDLEKVNSDIAHIGSTLQTYVGARLYFGVSDPFLENQRIYRALSEACQTCNEFFFDKEVTVRHFAPEQGAELREESLRLSCEEIEASLLAQKEEQAQELLRRFIGSAQTYRELERTVFTLILTLEKYDRSSAVSQILASAMQSDDYEALCAFLLDWIRGIHFQTDEGKNAYVEELITYIQSHLAEDLSLKALAGAYHLSANYLGKLFYQQTGVYLNNYVSNCRIKKACELISATNLPMGEIGQQVGIEDPHYFSKLFKDKMGLTPNRYRSQT